MNHSNSRALFDRAVRVTKRSKFQPVLIDLRDQVRSVVKEVRETLYDLRTDVSDVQDVGTTMQIFCDRVHARSGLEIKIAEALEKRKEKTKRK